MVSERTQDALWQLIFDVERSCLYYEKVNIRKNRQNFFVRFAILSLVLVTGVFPFFVDSLPGPVLVYAFITMSLLIVVVGITVWDALADNAQKASFALFIHLQMSKLRSELLALWIESEKEDVSEDLIMEKVVATLHEYSYWEGFAGAGDILNYESLNKETTKNAEYTIIQRYDLNRGLDPSTRQTPT